MKKAIIWRESIYKNHFKCNKCGTKLWNEDTNTATDDLGTAGTKWMFCMNCRNNVAFIADYDGDRTGGRWEDA